MSGTKAGAKLAKKRMIEKYGEDYYSVIGKRGGKLGKTGGFYHYKYVKGDDNHARVAGAKGGAASKRVARDGTA